MTFRLSCHRTCRIAVDKFIRKRLCCSIYSAVVGDAGGFSRPNSKTGDDPRANFYSSGVFPLPGRFPPVVCSSTCVRVPAWSRHSKLVPRSTWQLPFQLNPILLSRLCSQYTPVTGTRLQVSFTHNLSCHLPLSTSTFPKRTVPVEALPANLRLCHLSQRDHRKFNDLTHRPSSRALSQLDEVVLHARHLQKPGRTPASLSFEASYTSAVRPRQRCGFLPISAG